MQKKVGIITFHCADNFGATLQAYALQKAIDNLGFHSEIIDFRPSILVRPYKFLPPEKLSLMAITKFIIKWLLIKNRYEHRSQLYEFFRKEFMVLSNKRYLLDADLRNDPPVYDIYIVGSDQVWNPIFLKETGFSYLLDFLPTNVYKVSYASSVVEPIPDELSEFYEKYLSQFASISVREKASAEILRKILKERPIYISLDPVFLINKEHWLTICKEPQRKPRKNFIFVIDYVQNPEYNWFVNQVANELSMDVISFSFSWRDFLKPKYVNHRFSVQFEGPREILWYIANAEAILTSSFHGLAFSLIFEKKFACMVHPSRGNRMVDLLSELGLQKWLIYPETARKNVKVPEKPPYESFQKLIEMREESLHYLKQILEKKMR